MPNKSSIVAFLLSFIPGAGHLYMNRVVRAILYGAGFFGPLFLMFVGAAFFHMRDDDILIPLFLFALFVAVINMIDMIVYLLRYQPYPGPQYGPQYGPHGSPYGAEPPYDHAPAWEPNPYAVHAASQQERTRVMLLSFIPGLGHFQLGLMQRGLTAMVSFFGVAVLVFFITMMTNNDSFVAFLLAMPVLWFYTMFDALKQQERKQDGLPLIDRSLFDDFHFGDDSGRKNRTLATIIAIFPGAAHLYLSMNKRGIQLMAIFLFSIYVLDVLRLSLFFFLIPILWFFSFFDGLQSISKYENGTLVDKPIVENWSAYHRSIGFVLILLGGYYVFKEVIVQFLYQVFPHANYMYWLNNFGQTLIVAVILIGGGIKLLLYRKTRPVHSKEQHTDSDPSQVYLEINEKKNPF
ncbi:hypothetical protein HZF08_29920 [Paenibacillus sp. CGMCC 1.16610]|uniref:hypothetical protein n=1 Tax=Paenibacillus TaxID=44249 RepID=UPI0015EE841E|nr:MULTISPECIES: hypothetical protein [Paenibacillus]MBA2942497.1 hypothetical protein [Paenibacillus sp. CGMCC 1.16610]